MTVLRKLSVAARHNEFTWRYLFNMAPSLAYRAGAAPVALPAGDVIARLNRDGVALTSVSEIFGADAYLFDDLAETVTREEQAQAAAIEAARKAVEEAGPDGTKHFIYELLGPLPPLDTASIYVRFALHERLLQIANGYFGMYTRFRQYNVWRTFACKSDPRNSQLWHRDREDRLILKVFLYLNDIGEGQGPFTYAPGTHQKGPIRAIPESFSENGVRRTTDEQMARVVPANRWIKAIGKKGSILLADTHGYHKGGLARTGDRLMYLAMYTSPASESRELMARPAAIEAGGATARNVALAGPRRRFWLSVP